MPEEVVQLPKNLEAFVDAEERRGDCRNRNEVFLLALALLRLKRQEQAEKEASLRHAIGLAVEQLDRGQIADERSAAEVISNIKAKQRGDIL